MSPLTATAIFALTLAPLGLLATLPLARRRQPRVALATAPLLPLAAWWLAPGDLELPVVLLGSRLLYDLEGLTMLAPVAALCVSAAFAGSPERRRERREDAAVPLLLTGSATACLAGDLLLTIAAGSVAGWSALMLCHHSLHSAGGKRATVAFLVLAELSLFELALMLKTGTGSLELSSLGTVTPDMGKYAGFVVFAGVGLGARGAALTYLLFRSVRRDEPGADSAGRSCYIIAAMFAGLLPAALRALDAPVALAFVASSVALAMAAFYSLHQVLAREWGVHERQRAAPSEHPKSPTTATFPVPTLRVPLRLRRVEALLNRWEVAMCLAVTLGLVLAWQGF